MGQGQSRHLFDRLDTSNNGTLSLGELLTLPAIPGIRDQLIQPQLAGSPLLLRVFNENSSGSLQFEEFERLISFLSITNAPDIFQESLFSENVYESQMGLGDSDSKLLHTKPVHDRQRDVHQMSGNDKKTINSKFRQNSDNPLGNDISGSLFNSNDTSDTPIHDQDAEQKNYSTYCFMDAVDAAIPSLPTFSSNVPLPKPIPFSLVPPDSHSHSQINNRMRRSPFDDQTHQSRTASFEIPIKTPRHLIFEFPTRSPASEFPYPSPDLKSSKLSSWLLGATSETNSPASCVNAKILTLEKIDHPAHWPLSVPLPPPKEFSSIVHESKTEARKLPQSFLQRQQAVNSFPAYDLSQNSLLFASSSQSSKLLSTTRPMEKGQLLQFLQLEYPKHPFIRNLVQRMSSSISDRKPKKLIHRSNSDSLLTAKSFEPHVNHETTFVSESSDTPLDPQIKQFFGNFLQNMYQIWDTIGTQLSKSNTRQDMVTWFVQLYSFDSPGVITAKNIQILLRSVKYDDIQPRSLVMSTAPEETLVWQILEEYHVPELQSAFFYLKPEANSKKRRISLVDTKQRKISLSSIGSSSFIGTQNIQGISPRVNSDQGPHPNSAAGLLKINQEQSSVLPEGESNIIPRFPNSLPKRPISTVYTKSPLESLDRKASSQGPHNLWRPLTADVSTKSTALKSKFPLTPEPSSLHFVPIGGGSDISLASTQSGRISDPLSSPSSSPSSSLISLHPPATHILQPSPNLSAKQKALGATLAAKSSPIETKSPTIGVKPNPNELFFKKRFGHTKSNSAGYHLSLSTVLSAKRSQELTSASNSLSEDSSNDNISPLNPNRASGSTEITNPIQNPSFKLPHLSAHHQHLSTPGLVVPNVVASQSISIPPDSAPHSENSSQEFPKHLASITSTIDSLNKIRDRTSSFKETIEPGFEFCQNIYDPNDIDYHMLYCSPRAITIEEFQILIQRLVALYHLKHLLDHKPIVDNYRILTCLGSGSTAIVMRLMHLSQLTFWAGKFLPHAFADRTAEEIAVQRLVSDHPNIASFHSILSYPSFSVLITELCNGGNLAHSISLRLRLWEVLFEKKFIQDNLFWVTPDDSVFDSIIQQKNTKPGKVESRHLLFNESTIALIFYQAIDALHFLHEKNIVHRDFRPENILFDSVGTVKLVDFGQGVQFSDDWDVLPGDEAAGSLFHTAPEQAPTPAGQPPSHYHGKPADMWSAGVTLYRLLTGSPPFCGQLNFTALFDDIRVANYPPIIGISQELQQLLASLLDPNPETRIKIQEVIQHKWFSRFPIESRTRMPLASFAHRFPLISQWVYHIMELHHAKTKIPSIPPSPAHLRLYLWNILLEAFQLMHAKVLDTNTDPHDPFFPWDLPNLDISKIRTNQTSPHVSIDFPSLSRIEVPENPHSAIIKYRSIYAVVHMIDNFDTVFSKSLFFKSSSQIVSSSDTKAVCFLVVHIYQGEQNRFHALTRTILSHILTLMTEKIQHIRNLGASHSIFATRKRETSVSITLSNQKL